MRTALLVIDVQRGLFDASPRPLEADTLMAWPPTRTRRMTRRTRPPRITFP